MRPTASRRKIYLNGTMLFGWMLLIFFFSHQPGSGGSWEPPLWYVLERKSAHIFEFAVLMLLAYRFFREVYVRETLYRMLLVAAVFSIAYGISDELHQFFIYGREARFTDILVDALGIIFMATLLSFWFSSSKIVNQKNR